MHETSVLESDSDPFAMAIPVSDRVQIQNVLIVESLSKRAPDERFAQGGFSLAHDFMSLGFEKLEDPTRLAIKLGFTLRSTRNGETEIDPTLSVAAIFIITYEISSFEGIEDANLQAFAATNGVYNAWPYWREFVQNMTVRMGLPAITAPVFRFPIATSSDKPPE